MSQSTTDERWSDCPRKAISCDASFGLQNQLAKKLPEASSETGFLGTFYNDSFTIERKYIDSQTHGIQLYYQELTPTPISAQIIIVHGFGEHSANYMQIADAFVQSNFKVYMYDQRGFGYSGGRRGSATVSEMHMDLDSVLQQIDRSIPLFIYCHSLGAALVYSFCLMNPTLALQGIISTSALLRVPTKYSKYKILLLRILNKLCPDLQVNTYLNLSFASKNNYHMKKMATDPLIWPYMSIQFAYNILLFQQFILPNANQFNVPVLLMHGKEDKVASHIDSLDFYRLVKTKEKTLKIFENGFHEPQNDSEWPKMKQFMIQWCQKMLKRDVKVSFNRELNYGVKLSNKSNTKKNLARILLILAFILLRNKLKCLKILTKLSFMGICELLVRLLISN